MVEEGRETVVLAGGEDNVQQRRSGGLCYAAVPRRLMVERDGEATSMAAWVGDVDKVAVERHKHGVLRWYRRNSTAELY